MLVQCLKHSLSCSHFHCLVKCHKVFVYNNYIYLVSTCIHAHEKLTFSKLNSCKFCPAAVWFTELTFSQRLELFNLCGGKASLKKSVVCVAEPLPDADGPGCPADLHPAGSCRGWPAGRWPGRLLDLWSDCKLVSSWISSTTTSPITSCTTTQQSTFSVMLNTLHPDCHNAPLVPWPSGGVSCVVSYKQYLHIFCVLSCVCEIYIKGKISIMLLNLPFCRGEKISTAVIQIMSKKCHSPHALFSYLLVGTSFRSNFWQLWCSLCDNTVWQQDWACSTYLFLYLVVDHIWNVLNFLELVIVNFVRCLICTFLFFPCFALCEYLLCLSYEKYW